MGFCVAIIRKKDLVVLTRKVSHNKILGGKYVFIAGAMGQNLQFDTLYISRETYSGLRINCFPYVSLGHPCSVEDLKCSQLHGQVSHVHTSYQTADSRWSSPCTFLPVLTLSLWANNDHTGVWAFPPGPEGSVPCWLLRRSSCYLSTNSTVIKEAALVGRCTCSSTVNTFKELI